jgi:hypothetical protein
MRQWFAWRTGVAAPTADRLVTIAERIDELPVCLAAFRAGELSLDQMAAIARRAPAWSDEQMCTFARSMTVRQISRVANAYPRDEAVGEGDGDASPESDDAVADADPNGASDVADRPGGDGDRDRPAGPLADAEEGFCSLQWDDQGRLRLHAVAPADVGLVIEAAMREARDRLFHDGADVTWLDALEELANRSLDRVAEPSRRRRCTISLFLDTDGTMTDASAWRLPDAIRDHVTCDGAINPVYRDGGRPVSVGRQQHIVPERTRRLVEHRDHGRCRVPGCTARHFLEVHHIIHWLAGGLTDTENLVSLCPHHHRLHHRGRLGISGNADAADGDADAVVFTDHSGRPIRPSGARPIPPAGPPPPPTGVYRHPTGERLDPSWLALRVPETSRAAVA